MRYSVLYNNVFKPNPHEYPFALTVVFYYLLLGANGLVASNNSFASQLSSHIASHSNKYAYYQALGYSLKNAITDSASFHDRFGAEAWLVATSEILKPFIKDPQERLDILQKVHRAATQAGLEPELILAVIQIESAFDPYAISRVGAQGMMQVIPFWKNEIGRPNDNLISLETNLRYGCTILKHYLDREKGHYANALARYNGSYVSYHYSKKVMAAQLDYWSEQ